MTTQEKLVIKEQEESVEQYEFEPIKGYPMLNWRGKRPFTSTQYYPAQLKEVHGEEVDGWRNKIYWGDNLQVMSHLLKEFRGKIDLIYIDPPFDSRADYKKTVSIKGSKVANAHSSFEEKQYTDIWTNDEYLQFMYERLVIIRELMSSNASIYVHCDYRKSHHLRCLMDEIFGPENIRSEISWRKLTSAKSQSNFFPNVKDTILFYSKGVPAFQSQYLPKDEDDPSYPYIEEDTGRKYGSFDFTQAGQGEPRKFGDEILPPPPGKHWIWSQEKIDMGLKQGRIIFTKNGTPRVKRYLDEKAGNSIGDLWTDDGVSPLSANDAERLNYPTQKPEALIQRIIEASSNEGDLVFDCFMGSGTLQAAAAKLGRKYIGADINLGAIQTTTKRLIDVLRGSKPLLAPQYPLTGFEIYNVNNYDLFRNPIQAKELLLEALEVNTIQTGAVFDGEKDGRMIKIMPVNRIATKADLGQIITGIDWKSYEKRQSENPNKPVEKITLVCMGHEPDLAGQLELELKPLKIDVEVVDILRDKANLEFKRDSQARVVVKNGQLNIEAFYPMNLLQKLSLQKENVEDWRELVESVLIDWNYDGAVLNPTTLDIPEKKDDLVAGTYPVPKDAGTIRVKITDLLSESWEGNIHD